MRLEDKVCVITGAAGGIGAAAVSLFSEEGATVVGVDLRDDVQGVDLALAADVASEEDVIRFLARAREEYGRIDVLFNNAGISPDDDASVVDTTLETWQRVQDVNLRSVLLCCKHGIPHVLDAAARAVRERPGAGRPAADPPADGTLRRRARDRVGSAVPRFGRVVLHHRVDVHGRRRPVGRLRHPGIGGPERRTIVVSVSSAPARLRSVRSSASSSAVSLQATRSR